MNISGMIMPGDRENDESNKNCPGAATASAASSEAYTKKNSTAKPTDLQQPLTDPSVSELFRVLDKGRLMPFVTACKGDRHTALRLYSWNIAVSAAFWGSFNVFEVAVRNAIHTALSATAGSERWWDSDLPFHTLEKQRVKGAFAVAKKSKGDSVTPGHVIAELNLGFWTGLLSNKYHQRLWVPTLNRAFPHLEGTRRELHRKQESLRKLRNRIAHHEPIFARNLAADHTQLLSILASISGDSVDWVQINSRVLDTLARRDEAVTGEGPMSF